MPKNCTLCGILAEQQCARCSTPYCSPKCQYLDWKVHGMKCIQAANTDDFQDEIPILPDESSDDEFQPPKRVPNPPSETKVMTSAEIREATMKVLKEHFTEPILGEKFGDWMKRWPKDLTDKIDIEKIYKKKMAEKDEYKLREIELYNEWLFSQFYEHSTTTLEEKAAMKKIMRKIDDISKLIHSQTKTEKNMATILRKNQVKIEKLMYQALRVFNFAPEHDAPMTPKQRASVIFNARFEAEKAFPTDILPDGNPTPTHLTDFDDELGDEKDNFSKVLSEMPEGHVPIPGLKDIMERLKRVKRIVAPNATEQRHPYPFFTMTKQNGEFVVVDRDEYNDFQRRTRDFIHDQFLPTHDNFVKMIENVWYDPDNTPFRQGLSAEYEEWLANQNIGPRVPYGTKKNTPEQEQQEEQETEKRKSTRSKSKPRESASWQFNSLRPEQPQQNKPKKPKDINEYQQAYDEMADKCGQCFRGYFNRSVDFMQETAEPALQRGVEISSRTNKAIRKAAKTDISWSSTLFTLLAIFQLILWGSLLNLENTLVATPVDLVADTLTVSAAHVNLHQEYKLELDAFEYDVSNWFEQRASILHREMFSSVSSTVVDYYSPRYLWNSIVYGYENLDTTNTMETVLKRVGSFIQTADFEQLKKLREYFTIEILYRHSISFIDKPSEQRADTEGIIEALKKLQILRNTVPAFNLIDAGGPSAVNPTGTNMYTELVSMIPRGTPSNGIQNMIDQMNNANVQVTTETPGTTLEQLRDIVLTQANEYVILEHRTIEAQYGFWHQRRKNIKKDIENNRRFNQSYVWVKEEIRKLREEDEGILTPPQNEPNHIIDFNAFILRNESTRHLYFASDDASRLARDDLLHEWLMTRSLSFPNGFQFFNQSFDDILALNFAAKKGYLFKTTDNLEELKKEFRKTQKTDLEHLRQSRFYLSRRINVLFKSIVFSIWDYLGSARWVLGGLLALGNAFSILGYGPLDPASKQSILRNHAYVLTVVRASLVSVGAFALYSFTADWFTNVVYMDQLAQEYDAQNGIPRVDQIDLNGSGLTWILNNLSFIVSSLFTVIPGGFSAGTINREQVFSALVDSAVIFGILAKVQAIPGFFIYHLQKKTVRHVIYGILAASAPLGVDRLTRSLTTTSIVLNNYRAWFSPTLEYYNSSREPKHFPFSDDFNSAELIVNSQRYVNRIAESLPKNRKQQFDRIREYLEFNLGSMSPPIVPTTMPLDELMSNTTTSFRKLMDDTDFWFKQSALLMKSDPNWIPTNP